MLQQHTSQMMPLGELQLDPENPREMSAKDMDALRRSLKTYGYIERIAVRAEDCKVIGGHQRIHAIRRILMEAEPDGFGMSEEEANAQEFEVVVIEGLTDDGAKVLNLALNKISGDWDYPKLAAMLDSIKDMPVDALTISGFSKGEMEDILNLSSMKDATTKDDEEPEASVDVDKELSAKEREFAFSVETDEQAMFIKRVLRAYGMTGPSNIADGFLAALSAAAEIKGVDALDAEE